LKRTRGNPKTYPGKIPKPCLDYRRLLKNAGKIWAIRLQVSRGPMLGNRGEYEESE